MTTEAAEGPDQPALMAERRGQHPQGEAGEAASVTAERENAHEEPAAVAGSFVLHEPPWYGTVCPVVWEDGGSNPASYPMAPARRSSRYRKNAGKDEEGGNQEIAVLPTFSNRQDQHTFRSPVTAPACFSDAPRSSPRRAGRIHWPWPPAPVRDLVCPGDEWCES